jgi:hypothetical protein
MSIKFEEVFALLGCYAALIASYRLLGQPVCLTFKGEAVQEELR